MKYKIAKVLTLSLIVLGMFNIPMVQAGKPHDVRAGEYGLLLQHDDPATWVFHEDEATYILWGWAYLEWEWKVYPMPIKTEVWVDDIEFKVHRFAVKLDAEEYVTPAFFFYVLFEPYTFSPGEHFLEVFFTFHGVRCDEYYWWETITVLPEGMPT